MVALLAAAGCGVAASPASRAEQDRRQTGLQTVTWMVDGVSRTGLVHLPRGGTPAGSGAPLVLVFHGHGGTSQQAARTFGIHSHWPEAVVIYPQGLPTPGRLTDPEGRRPGWQHAAGDQGDRDLGLVDAMMAWAREQRPIDPRRVFAAGHSNGATLTYVLWANRAADFAAFAPSSGVFGRQNVATTPKPAFVVAGRQDELVRFALQEASLRVMLRLNQAATEGKPWSGGALKHASPIGADVVAYIHDGGHAMPSDAGALMVKFFQSIGS